MTIDRSTFDGNSVDATSGNAAGLYLENVQLAITNTTISNNTGHYGGGLWAGQSDILDLQNVTIASNTASGGGGVWFANGVTGTIKSTTVAANTGDGLFGGDTGVTLQNSHHREQREGHARQHDQLRRDARRAARPTSAVPVGRRHGVHGRTRRSPIRCSARSRTTAAP